MSSGFTGLAIRYTLARLVLFLGCCVLLALVGLHGLPLALVALLVSSALSLFVLRRMREQYVAAMTERGERRRAERARLLGQLEEADPPTG